MDENPVERARLYLDGFEDKNELQVGPYMLAWALQSLLEHHLATLPAETSADDGAPTRHTLSAPDELNPEPQDEAIGGLIERLKYHALAAQPGHLISDTFREAASALSRLREELAQAELERDDNRAEAKLWGSDADRWEARAFSAESSVGRLVEALRRVLARDAEWGLSGQPNDCGCIRLSRQGEREYENGTCPHQKARAALSLVVGGTTSSQSQPCSETGPNSPSSPQTPFSDGGGEP